MGPFRENAFYLLAWRAFLVALIALALIVTRSFELAAAFLIGANVALLFSLGLIVWSERLTEQRIVWTEAWRMLKPSRPQVGTQLPQRRGIALRPGRIGFGDCLVCIGAHARDRVAAVATRDRKRVAPGAAVHAAMLLNLRDRSKVRMSRSNIAGGEAPSHSGALPRR
jgi:hypothetical protein